MRHLLKNRPAFKFTKCFSPVEWNRLESGHTPRAHWNEKCLKNHVFHSPPRPLRNSKATLTAPLKCWPPLKKHKLENGSWFTNCLRALLKSETFMVVDGRFKASHYPAQSRCALNYYRMFFPNIFVLRASLRGCFVGPSWSTFPRRLFLRKIYRPNTSKKPQNVLFVKKVTHLTIFLHKYMSILLLTQAVFTFGCLNRRECPVLSDAVSLEKQLLPSCFACLCGNETHATRKGEKKWGLQHKLEYVQSNNQL